MLFSRTRRSIWTGLKQRQGIEEGESFVLSGNEKYKIGLIYKTILLTYTFMPPPPPPRLTSQTFSGAHHF